MAMPILKTKLYGPPVREDVISRPRLIERLNARPDRKLTLISAPAGFGKTTLAAEWLHSAGRPSSWVSLDEGDNDPARFLGYAVAALQNINARIGKSVQQEIARPLIASIEPLLADLINDIAAHSPPFILVLDDYHAITSQQVHKIIHFLVARQPPQMHLVILSRQDPPLPLPLLRGRGQLTEVRQSDLCFTLEEASAFLNQSMRLGLDAASIAALEAHTEGWIAGLQLAAFAIGAQSAQVGPGSVSRFIAGFSGRHHFILDYLADEVLRHQPESIYSFLLRTSILERLCGSLCDAVMDLPNGTTPMSGQQILEQLQRANLFIVPLDGERHWYRYHLLFGDLLQARLHTSTPKLAPDLHRRAAVWFEQNALPVEAVRHTLAIPDYSLAGDMIERAISQPAGWSSINTAVLRNWLEALPADIVSARPRLRLFDSRLLYLSGQRDAANRILDELAGSLQDNLAHPDARELLGLVVADRASYAAVRGEVQLAIASAQQALTYRAEDDAMMRMRVAGILGLAYFRAGNMPESERYFSEALALASAAHLGFIAVPFLCNLTEVQINQGHLHRAMETCRVALHQAVIDDRPTSSTGLVGLEMAKILYEQDDLPEAERQVLESLVLLDRSGTTDSFGLGHALLARIRQARGDEAGALEAIRRAVQIAAEFGVRRVANLVSAVEASIWLAQGRIGQAVGWAGAYTGLGTVEYARDFEDLTLARVRLAQGRPADALALLDALLPAADTGGRRGTLIAGLALRALTLDAGDETDGALQALQQAHELAGDEGYVRVFVDAGPAMTRLIEIAAARGIALVAAERLRTAFAPVTGRHRQFAAPDLIEHLSDREMEVLDLLAAGLTNREIAQQLFISLPTVKSHTRNIYGKLGVHTRQEAVARARTLGVLR